MKKIKLLWLILFFCYFLELLFRFIQIPQIERHILDYKNNIWYPNLIVSNKYDIELEEILSPFSLIAWEFAKLWRDPKVFRMLKTWESQEYTGVIRSKAEYSTIEQYQIFNTEIYQTRVYPHVFPWQYLLFIKGHQYYIPNKKDAQLEELFVPFDVWFPIRWNGRVYMKQYDGFLQLYLFSTLKKKTIKWFNVLFWNQ